MSMYRTIGVVVLGCMLLVGCDSGEESSAPAVDTSAAEKAASNASTQTQNAANDAQKAAAGAAEEAQSAASSANSEAVAKAKELLEQATAYIKDNKFDLAEKTLNQLDKIKASLPQSMQQQIDSARSMLNAAQMKEKAGGIKVPGLK